MADATETTAGIVRFANNTETQLGVSTSTAVHPQDVKTVALTVNDKATTAEAIAGVNDAHFLTAAGLAALVASLTSGSGDWPDVGTPTVYDSDAVYTVPAGVHLIQVELLGGGGGGGGVNSGNVGGTGATGGSTSFGSIFAASGGAGGMGGNYYSPAGAGGLQGGFDVFAVVCGRNGYIGNNGSTSKGGDGGYASAMGNLRTGGPGTGPSSTSVGGNASGYGNGGAGGFWAYGGGGGGGGGFACMLLRVNPGETYNITIGAGGTGGTASTYIGGNGAPGRARVSVVG